ncbi:hypothetical protein H0X06_07000 [Candidatus Dependentiae bacterium]|nr:hypothetical protein [Candidatus Dependentiae bacterium]
MNIRHRYSFLACILLFGFAIKAETAPSPSEIYLNATGCLVGGMTTLVAIHLFSSDFFSTQKEVPKADNVPKSLMACAIIAAAWYTTYYTGLSAYTSYKKASDFKRTKDQDLTGSTEKKRRTTNAF